MADAKLSVTGAKLGMTKLDVAQVVSMGMEFHTTVCVQVFQSMIVQMRCPTKDHLIVNLERMGKSRGGEANMEAKTKETPPRNPETQENPNIPKTALKKKSLNHVNKATAELRIMENGEKSIVGVTGTMVSLVIKLLVNLQRNGAKGKKEKADGSQRSLNMREKAKSKFVSRNLQKNTENLHAARKVSDH